MSTSGGGPIRSSWESQVVSAAGAAISHHSFSSSAPVVRTESQGSAPDRLTWRVSHQCRLFIVNGMQWRHEPGFSTAWAACSSRPDVDPCLKWGFHSGRCEAQSLRGPWCGNPCLPSLVLVCSKRWRWKGSLRANCGKCEVSQGW